MIQSLVPIASGATPDPTPAQIIGLIVVLLIVAASLAVVVIQVCVAAVLPPPRPLAETSVLGRHFVGLARIVMAFLGFFGGLLLTTMIALGGDHWGSARGVDELMNQLWSVFLILIAAAAYGYWLWTAIDLIRLGPTRRLAAVDWWYRKWLTRIGARWVERAVRAVAQAVVGGPWWAILLTFYMAPLILIVAATELVRMSTTMYLP